MVITQFFGFAGPGRLHGFQQVSGATFTAGLTAGPDRA